MEQRAPEEPDLLPNLINRARPARNLNDMRYSVDRPLRHQLELGFQDYKQEQAPISYEFDKYHQSRDVEKLAPMPQDAGANAEPAKRLSPL